MHFLHLLCDLLIFHLIVIFMLGVSYDLQPKCHILHTGVIFYIKYDTTYWSYIGPSSPFI